MLGVASHRRLKRLGSFSVIYYFLSVLMSLCSIFLLHLVLESLLSFDICLLHRVKFLTEDGLFDMIRKTKPKQSAASSQSPVATEPVKGLC